MPSFSSLGNQDDLAFPEYHDLLESCQYSVIDNFNQLSYSPFNLFIIHVNIRSLPKNFDSLQQLVNNLKNKPHVILVTETWLENGSLDAYKLKNYNLEATSQIDFRGKGAAMYIDTSLVYSRKTNLESTTEQFQSVFIELKNIGNRSIIIGSIYRSPSFPANHLIDYLEQTLETVNNEHKLSLFGGDLNIDILKHESDETCSNFVTSLSSLCFFPCISLPTRIISHSATLIDNFFCNDPSFVMSPTVFAHDISDHLPIGIYINMKISPHNKTFVNSNKSFDFRNINKLKESISVKLADFLQITCAESACSSLINSLSDEISRYSIKKTNRRSVPIQPWISHGLLRCINKKNLLHKKFIHSPTQLNHDAFKSYRNTLTRVIRTAKSQYFKRKLCEVRSDSKKLWQVLLTVIRKNKSKEDLPNHFVVNNAHIDQPDIISNKFNTYFCNIANALDAVIPHSSTDPLSYLHATPPSKPFAFHPTDPDTVKHIIYNLNNCGAGVDGISTKILKIICPCILPHLTHLFNLCLLEGTFPSCFKKAIIVPIFKSGDRFSFNNYRPIAILPTISKILAKLYTLNYQRTLLKRSSYSKNNLVFANIIAPTCLFRCCMIMSQMN